jgi:hypothetical protein
MKQISLIVVIILILTSSKDREIVVDDTGFGNIRIGKTRLSEIKRKHVLSKLVKTSRHALYRTEEGKVGVTYHYVQIQTRKGIAYFFNYQHGTKESITLDEILFSIPAVVRTKRV